MKLTKNIPLPNAVLTADLMAQLSLGESVTALCDSAREFDNTRRTAYYNKREQSRPDGNGYKVETSTVNSTVTVTVTRKA